MKRDGEIGIQREKRGRGRALYSFFYDTRILGRTAKGTQYCYDTRGEEDQQEAAASAH